MNIVTTLLPALPEIFVVVMACIILMNGVFAKKNVSCNAFYLAQLTLLVSALLSIHGLTALTGTTPLYAFHHTFVLDRLAVILKVFIDIAMIFTFWFARNYNETNKIPATEFYVLGLLATFGMMVLLSAADFITLFLGVELMSLPIYAMVAMMRSKMRCIEAAMKYFIIGSVASGLLLYGLSMFFGATQSLQLSTVAQAIAQTPLDQQLILYFGLVFVIAGIAFKLGAVPFHMWVPDVYDGAPNSVTLLISAAPKLAAFGLAIRFLTEAAPGLHLEWQQVLIVVGLLSIALGNVAAVMQTNIKRLLAYSSIAHMGYMILGLAAGTVRGDAAAMFYMVSYTITAIGTFGLITMLSKMDFEFSDISDLSGLSVRSPWLAFMMLLMLFSLAGIPPMVGFMAKVSILEALIQVHTVWLAVVAIIFSVIGAYYYIRVVKVMYFEEPAAQALSLTSPLNLTVAMTINGLAVLLLGIFPNQLFLLCKSVF